MRFSQLIYVLLMHGLAAGTALAQDSGISGHWARDPYASKIPRADLVAAVSEAVLAAQAASDAYAIRWCNAVGMPALMDADLDIRVSRRFMIISSGAYSYPRYVYFDLPARDPEILDPASVGYSDGRWEGESLIVDSYGFAGYDYPAPEGREVRGLTKIPGGGFRTPRSRLTERFHLTEDAQSLIVEATWTDPTVFKTPHTYTVRYQRRNSGYEPPPELPCDPFDPERVEFLSDAHVLD